jgi:ribosomal protein S18 acetylase RimI-like enzyme
MYDCVALSKKNLNHFKKLNEANEDFNNLNENFFEVYDDCNFAQQIFLRRRVKLLKKDFKYVGYIWTEINDGKICIVKSLNVLRRVGDFKDYAPYKILIDSISDNYTINYLCENNDYNSNVLKDIGFIKREGTLILYLNMLENIPLILRENLEFQILKKGRDEQKRCNIQNEIFKNDSRVPLTIEDIYFDESQNYYFEQGSVFLKKDGEYIGYGQVIIENNTPIIVNFGILSRYRGNGYSKSLLSYLLKIIKYNGYNRVKIKVKNTNKIALSLYEGIGFEITKEIYNWEFKK